MKLFIKTTAAGCHVSVNIKTDDKNKVILNVSENGNGFVNLVPGQNYRFEWFVFATKDGKATITANVDPTNTGFLPLVIENDYSAGDRDGNIFFFTLN